MAAGAAFEATPTVPLFGRQETLDEVARILDEARDGAGRFIALHGDAGVGKTTVLRASERLASEDGFRLLRARALPRELPTPLALIQDLLKSSRFDGPSPDDEPAARTDLPLFAAGIEYAATGDPAEEAAREVDRLVSHLGSSPERVDSSRSTVFNRIGNLLAGWAEEQPLLLSIDDLEFADDSSLDFLASFLGLVPHRPVVVLATMPPVESVPVRSARSLGRLLADPVAVPLTIRPMTQTELGDFARWVLNGRDPGRPAVMRWFSQTEGNPLFAEHLVRASEGLSTSAPPVEDGSDVVDVLRRRIAKLPETERRALAYAAVLGKEFDFSTLARLAGGDGEERLSESIDHLVHGGILREKGGEVYEFVTEPIRADVYGRLTETRRRILHKKAGESLESRGVGSPASIDELARQFFLGRDDAKALEYSRRAADLAARAFAFDTAVVHLERALESARRRPQRDPGLEIRLAIELGRYLAELGDLKRSEHVFLDAVARARSSPAHSTELALALLGLARTRSDMSEYRSARDLAADAFGILSAGGHERGLLAAYQVLGVACWRMGDLVEAETHQRALIRLAEKVGTADERAHALIDLANTLTTIGPDRYPESVALYDRAAELFRDSDDFSARARVMMNRALMMHNVGDMDRAIHDMGEAIGFAEKSHSRIWLGYSTMNMGQFLVEVNRLDEARAALDRASTLFEPLDDPLARQQVTMIRGMLSEQAGDLPGAESMYHTALSMAREVHLGPEVAEMEYRLAKLALKAGNVPNAATLLAAAKKDGIVTLRGDLRTEVEKLASEIFARTQGTVPSASATPP